MGNISRSDLIHKAIWFIMVFFINDVFVEWDWVNGVEYQDPILRKDKVLNWAEDFWLAILYLVTSQSKPQPRKCDCDSITTRQDNKCLDKYMYVQTTAMLGLVFHINPVFRFFKKAWLMQQAIVCVICACPWKLTLPLTLTLPFRVHLLVRFPCVPHQMSSCVLIG